LLAYRDDKRRTANLLVVVLLIEVSRSTELLDLLMIGSLLLMDLFTDVAGVVAPLPAVSEYSISRVNKYFNLIGPIPGQRGQSQNGVINNKEHCTKERQYIKLYDWLPIP